MKTNKPTPTAEKEKKVAILTSKCERGFRIANDKVLEFNNQKSNIKIKEKNKLTISKISQKINVKDEPNKPL